MTKTPDFIDVLVECATPVRRLRPPLVRVLWLALVASISPCSPSGTACGPISWSACMSLFFVVSIAAALAAGVLGGRGGVHG